MIKVTVIALGKLKEDYLRKASAEYEKRLSGFCKLNIVEIEPVKLPDNPSDKEIETALLKEAVLIDKNIPKNTFNVACCIEGKMITSEELSTCIEKSAIQTGSVTFIIGSSYGLSEAVKKKADLKLSVSAMTFPHQLFRVMLLEQLYRAFKIEEGTPYHK